MTTLPLPPKPCALCSAVAPLEDSHLISQFVYRWLKDTSGTGFLRFGPAINRRVQDGITVPLLCGACEDRFCAWEAKFARLVFHPFVGGKLGIVKYDDWLLKFAVSVCWRILEDAHRENRLGHFWGRWSAQLPSCRETWKRFLLGVRQDVGEHHVHMLPWDGIIGGDGPTLPTNINRYLRRAVEMDVACSDDEAFVYAKLGPILLFGMIGYPGPKQWRGTRIHLEGKLKPRDFLAPAQYRDYIFRRAQRMAELESQISPRQLQKITDTTKPDRLAGSGTYTATEMDYRLFGDTTFRK